ncbi:hypothetical protein ACWEQ3_32080 [Streptomyces mirabilis]
MTQHALNTPVCRDCDGFASAAITTGSRNSDGSRTTLRIVCRSCKGTGHVLPVAVLARAGR